MQADVFEQACLRFEQATTAEDRAAAEAVIQSVRKSPNPYALCTSKELVIAFAVVDYQSICLLHRNMITMCVYVVYMYKCILYIRLGSTESEAKRKCTISGGR